MKIRNALIAAGAALAVSAAATAAFAAGSVSTTAPASVTVLSPVTITKTQNLVFGSVIRPSNTGTNTVSLDQNDSISISGSGNGSLVTSTVSSAKFDVAGVTGTTFTTTQSLSFTQAGPTNVTATVPIASNGTLGTIPASGVQELRYGGSFDMHAATTAQAYTGNLSVTINYN